MLIHPRVTECGCICCVSCAYKTFADQEWAHCLEEYGPAAPSGLSNAGLSDVVPPYKRDHTPGHLKESDLHCPVCNGPVDQKPKPLPLLESVCRALNTTDAGAAGGEDLLLSHDLEQSFQ